ncbi:hypothetical protein CP157_03887 (plasmid) [Paracoccus marcusii]|nr:hypothetical protein [Paracoccus marcusii]QXI66095.1 hypothetical protein CP157_03887 [Paracoccus marcusii]
MKLAEGEKITSQIERRSFCKKPPVIQFSPPFAWEEDRRAHLRADLDAFYAFAYGLTRNELRYILDSADEKGPDYPSETIRVLKEKEIRQRGEYRTRLLVFTAGTGWGGWRVHGDGDVT